jgi:hypothetical protein
VIGAGAEFLSLPTRLMSTVEASPHLQKRLAYRRPAKISEVPAPAGASLPGSDDETGGSLAHRLERDVRLLLYLKNRDAGSRDFGQYVGLR